MTDGEAARWAPDETVLLIAVPEAEPLMGGTRERYGPEAEDGIPAHVTVLYPFLPAGRIDAGVLADLRDLFAGHEPFGLTFTGFGRFPEVLWPAPEPDGPVRALTAAVTARWPEAPPYGGAYDDPVPHLTVAHKQPEATYAAVEREFAPGLPLRAGVTEVRLMVREGVRWHHRASFPLRGGGGRNGVGPARP
ncbi:2'-5' RNA ligase family protein [Streptomyces sp.]|uniref:2'-5' RNA ligase family protein n=1 Tax=Streptomyces sp. TaxID=1931 RepID=UPI002F4154DE